MDLILHAGDVGDASILDELSNVAPVIAVRGNVDEGPDLIFGHSHIPFLESGPTEAPVLYFNPASAGRERFGKPRLTGMLTVGPGGVRGEHLDLESSE